MVMSLRFTAVVPVLTSRTSGLTQSDAVPLPEVLERCCTFQQWKQPPGRQVFAGPQLPVMQSPGTWHILSWAQRVVGAHAPPQSLSVSVPFITPSMQVGAWQVVAQTPDEQSVAALHFFPTAHTGQGPPQSTSVSVPLATLSVHVGSWQALPTHTPLWQSPALPQMAAVGHFAQEPPQSTSLSVPFRTRSLHVGA